VHLSPLGAKLYQPSSKGASKPIEPLNITDIVMIVYIEV